MVVVEDVDLIAEDRGEHPGRHALLFQLLNEMYGLEEDADVVFVLTTNRPDLLEPALASHTDAPETEGLQVAAADPDEALEELLSTRNTMTRMLLGVSKTRSGSGR